MEKEKNIMMKNYYLKVIIQMIKEMDMEKNMIMMVD